MTRIFITYLILQAASAKLNPLSVNSVKMRYSLSSCVLTATEEFKNDDVVTLLLSIKDYINYTSSVVVTDQLLLGALNREARFTLLVKKTDKPEGPSWFFTVSDEYIIQVRDYDEFNTITNSLKKMSSWNPHAQFIIVTTTVFQNPQEVVKYIFERLWKETVLNAIVMLPQNNSSPILRVYSWFPFRNGSCGDRFDRAYITNSCQFGKFELNNPLFPEKIPRNMKGCPIKVRAVIWPPYVISPKDYSSLDVTVVNLSEGIEVKLMNTIAEIANLTVIYTVSQTKQDWGIIYVNGTTTGMMNAVVTGEADAGIGALAALNSRHSMFDFSVSYIRESITWCVPHGMPIPKWKCLIQIFTPTAWLFIFVSYISVSLSVWRFSEYENKESTSYKSPNSCFQNLLSMLIGQPVHLLPRLTKIRLLIMLWCIVALHLNAAFTSSLIRELTKPSYEPSIEKFTEILNRGFDIGLVSPSVKFIQTSEIRNHGIQWITCDDVKKCLDRAAYDRDLAVGIPRMYMLYASHKYVTKKGRKLVHWLKDDVVSYPIEILMTKGYPLLARINQLIYRIKEAGLIAKWETDSMENADNQTAPVSYNDDTETTLTLIHLEGAFILLFFGLVHASFVFICELFLPRRMRS